MPLQGWINTAKHWTLLWGECLLRRGAFSNVVKLPLELNAKDATVELRGSSALARSLPQSPHSQNTRCSRGRLLTLVSPWHCDSHCARVSYREHLGYFHDAVKHRTPNLGCSVNFRERHRTTNNSISLRHRDAHFFYNFKKSYLQKFPSLKKRPQASSKAYEENLAKESLQKPRAPMKVLSYFWICFRKNTAGITEQPLKIIPQLEHSSNIYKVRTL